MVILIPDHIAPPADIEQAVFGAEAEIVTPQALKTTDVPVEEWGRCDAVLTYDKIRYTPELIDRMPECRVIVRAGIGYDNIDLEAAARKGISVCNVPEYCSSEVADHTIGLMLALVRNILPYDAAVRRGQWPRSSERSFRLAGKTLGLVGFGRIARATARRAKALDLNVRAFDPFQTEDQFAAEGVTKAGSLADLAQTSDLISIHTPLTPETEKMIDGKFFSRCRQGMVLLNTARGGLIDFPALEQALKDGVVGACGLDALPNEPADFSDPLLRAYRDQEEWLNGRLIITPHTSYYSREALVELRRKSAEEALRVLTGQPPRNRVNDFAHEIKGA